MDERGWEECDFIFVSGDAYVDHPSFAAALLCRVLEAEPADELQRGDGSRHAGYRVGIIPQPDWKDPSSYTVLGKPRLGFLVGAGNMDSMVAHYTAAKRLRSDDAYSPNGKSGFRPDRATLVYVEGIRRAYKDAAVIIGGIEASLRRFAHYDYWSDSVRRSILLDSKADILVYGMGEKPLLQIARKLALGAHIGDIRDVRGTCVRVHGKEKTEQWKDAVFLPDYMTIKNKDEKSLRAYAEHFMIQKQNADPLSAKPLIEENDGDRFVIQNPPALPLTTEELDKIYELPFTRNAHPMYDDAGGIPALKEVSFSLVSSRGCFGGCSFCAITNHQGRAVTGRSKESLLREAKNFTTNHTRTFGTYTHKHKKSEEEFKGYIHDVGGPTANFFRPVCEKQKRGGFCAERECMFPSPCPQLKADHSEYLKALKALREIKGVKKVFIRSGIRFDYIQLDKKHGSAFMEELCRHHVSGQLKVAPEHVSANVLRAMGKCNGSAENNNADIREDADCLEFIEVSGYEKFKKDFTEINKRLGLKQYLLPYFICAHPGAAMKEAEELARYLKKTKFSPEQTQEFYPTPGTLSTMMYYTGLDPRGILNGTMTPIFTAKGDKERRKQKDLIGKK